MVQFAGSVPAAPVLTLPQALNNPYFVKTGGIQCIEHPERPGFQILSNTIRLDGNRPSATPAPKQGADTNKILRDAGFHNNEIASLRSEKVI